MAILSVKELRASRGRYGPDWRACLASNDQIPASEDRWLPALHRHLHAKTGDTVCMPQADAERALIAAAEALRDHQDLQLMLIGGLEPEEVARRINSSPAVVEAFEALFFDVRGTERANDWRSRFVISPAQSAGDVEFAARLRVAAMTGPVGTRVLLDVDHEYGQDVAEALVAKQLKLTQRMEMAMMAPVSTPVQSAKFVLATHKIVLAEKKLQFDIQKFKERCAERLQRHELTKLRLELAVQAAKARDAGETPSAGKRNLNVDSHRRRESA